MFSSIPILVYILYNVNIVINYYIKSYSIEPAVFALKQIQIKQKCLSSSINSITPKFSHKITLPGSIQNWKKKLIKKTKVWKKENIFST